MSEARTFLTKDQALAMLPEEGDVHTFRSSPGILVGADWRRSDVVAAIEKAGPEELEVGGPQCQAMGHSLVLWTRGEPLFIETKKESAP
jgi:hypothetical protein